MNATRLQSALWLFLALWLGVATTAIAQNAPSGKAPTSGQSKAASTPDPLAQEPGVLSGVESITAQEFWEQLNWWAHDDRGGREPGTKGNIEAGDVAAAEFLRLGLLPQGDKVQGARTYFQNFDKGGKSGIDGAVTEFKVGGRAFALDADFSIVEWTPKMKLVGLPVVFAGYGLQNDKLKWDDFKGVNVKGKAVLVIAGKPQAKDPKSRWAKVRRMRTSRYRKAWNAVKEGAKLVLLVDATFDQPLHPNPAKNPLRTTSSRRTRACPVLHIRPEVAAALLEGSGKTLDQLQRAIDEGDRPAPMKLAAKVTLRAERKLIRPARNIVALFPGSDPKLKNRVIVVGAHYDHIGLGAYGARNSSRRGEIHNGADDNATGSVGVLELAEAFAESGVKTRRSILFILFDAEEKGLYGSIHFVDKPTVPIERIDAMLNMDMIGHLKPAKLMTIGGTGTSAAWDDILGPAEHGSPITWKHSPGAFGGSDHLPFYRKQIPVLMFNSGLHAYYHTPDDDAERCNPQGARDILRTMFRITYLAANYTKKIGWSSSRTAKRGDLGVTVKTDRKARGARVTNVRAGTPAAAAGIKLDDLIVRIGKSRVTNRLGLNRALRKARPGQTFAVEVLRGETRMTIKVTFPRPRKPTPKKKRSL